MNNATIAGAFRLVVDNDALDIYTPYDPAFVGLLKAMVAPSARRWDATKRCWTVDPSAAVAAASAIHMIYGVDLPLPPFILALANVHAKPHIRAVRLDYLGACKPRDDGSISAFGHCAGGWSLIFPEQVLKAHFGAADDAQDDAEKAASAKPKRSAKPLTLYAQLGIKPEADVPQVKQAYRRLAKQWHPDICREANAAERFAQITHAYDVLSGPKTRRKYDAGLALAAKTQRAPSAVRAPVVASASMPYSAPLRCGMLLVEGITRMGRTTVAKILNWDDITNAAGQTLVVSWPAGLDKWIEVWT